jgi:predicted nucleic acid-binding protein
MAFVVTIDANALFPFTLRDTLLRAAAADLYQLRWSKQILDEVEKNLPKVGMLPAKAAKLRKTMEQYFPEADVTGYEPLIPSMTNDEKDRHVAAVAVKSASQVIVTFNLKDFASLPPDVDAQSPDEFLGNLFDLDPDGFVELLREQAEDLSNPAMTLKELLDSLAKSAPEFAEAARAHMGA